jgi:hypothetical protein
LNPKSQRPLKHVIRSDFGQIGIFTKGARLLAGPFTSC